MVCVAVLVVLGFFLSAMAGYSSESSVQFNSSPNFRPISRLASYTVFDGFRAACEALRPPGTRFTFVEPSTPSGVEDLRSGRFEIFEVLGRHMM